MKTLLVAAVLVTSALGCGGDGSAVPLDQYAHRIAASLCHATFRCCDASELGLGAPDTEAECVAAYEAQFQDGVDELAGALAAGRVIYDGDNLASCLGAADAAACGPAVSAAFGTCAPFVGTVALGGACERKLECTGGAFCDHVCVTPPSAGMACIGEDCGDDSFCMADPVTGYTCIAKRADGGACTSPSQCVSAYCDFDADVCAEEPVSTRCDGV
jgi:hypothetical protein